MSESEIKLDRSSAELDLILAKSEVGDTTKQELVQKEGQNDSELTPSG